MAQESSAAQKAAYMFRELQTHARKLKKGDNLTMMNQATQLGIAIGLHREQDFKVATFIYNMADSRNIPGLKAIYLFNGVLAAIYPNGALGKKSALRKKKIQPKELYEKLGQMFSIVPNPLKNLPIFLYWAWKNYMDDHKEHDFSKFSDGLQKTNRKGGAEPVYYKGPDTKRLFYNAALPDLHPNSNPRDIVVANEEDGLDLGGLDLGQDNPNPNPNGNDEYDDGDFFDGIFPVGDDDSVNFHQNEEDGLDLGDDDSVNFHQNEEDGLDLGDDDSVNFPRNAQNRKNKGSGRKGAKPPKGGPPNKPLLSQSKTDPTKETNMNLQSVRSSRNRFSRNRYSSSRRGRAAVVDVDDIADSIQGGIDQIVDYAREQDEMIAENETRLDNLESRLLHRQGRRYGGSRGGGRNRWF